MKNHTLPTVAVCLLLLLAISGSAKTKTITVTGWVSDENCGALHTKPGGEDCVLKCLKGGAHIGHPEWKPQRMVLVTDEGQKIWVVSNPEALKGLEGKHVTVTGQLNSATKKIRVSTAAKSRLPSIRKRAPDLPGSQLGTLHVHPRRSEENLLCRRDPGRSWRRVHLPRYC